MKEENRVLYNRCRAGRLVIPAMLLLGALKARDQAIERKPARTRQPMTVGTAGDAAIQYEPYG